MIQIRRILCPVDFSACSDHALEYALTLAQTYQADIELLHVMELARNYAAVGDLMSVASFDQIARDTETASTTRLAELAAQARQRYPQVSEWLVKGTPFVEIIEHAKARRIDLIVMGTHGRTGLPHLLIGSCAERVVRKAPCPVLTVRHPSHEFVMP